MLFHILPVSLPGFAAVDENGATVVVVVPV